MIAIYERVSSNKQDLASQHLDLEGWSTGKEVVWYSDKFTGKTMNRPAFNRLQQDINLGKITTVVCWRIDRLGRTAKGLTALFDDLVAKGINFISLKDGIDLATPAGRLIANVLASVASYETEVRGERIAAGLAVKRANVAAGKDVWNSGRRKGDNHKCRPEVVVAVKEQVGKGLSKTAIAKMFGLSRESIYQILRGEKEVA